MNYKCCAVPLCISTSIKTPKKMFVCVPRTVKKRKKWLQLARRDPNNISNNSVVYFCEDHFNMETDIANYHQYTMGFSQRIKTVDGALPSKFHCQQGTSQQTNTKRRTRKVIQECQNIQPTKIREAISEAPVTISTQIPSIHCNAPEGSGHKTMSQKTVNVELGWDNSASECASEEARAGLNGEAEDKLIDHVHIKQEPEAGTCQKNESELEDSACSKAVVSGSELQAPSYEFPLLLIKVKVEADYTNEEPECTTEELKTLTCIKQEPDEECNTVLIKVKVEPDYTNEEPECTTEELKTLTCIKQEPDEECNTGYTAAQTVTDNCQTPTQRQANPITHTEETDPLQESKVKSSDQDYMCAACSKTFQHRPDLIKHIKSHQPIDFEELPASKSKQTGEHSCETCGKRFVLQQTLIIHKRVHTWSKPYTCDVCNAQFTENGNLKRHIKRMHTERQTYACDICEEQFTHINDLRRHKPTHVDYKKIYSCGVCQKEFDRMSNWKRHKRVHTGLKPFTCQICNKDFTQSDGLKKHERIHSGHKPFSCPVCNKQFTDSSSSERHKRTHMERKKFTCEICDKQLARKDSWIRHMVAHGLEPP